MKLSMEKNNELSKELRITSAMVLAAGLGTRMRHLRKIRPKPLTPVAGRSLLDRLIDRLIEAGIEKIIINTHYMADMIESQMAKRDDCEIIFSREDNLLDTAGGTAKALPLLGDEPFFAINSDALWLDEGMPILKEMPKVFDAEIMDHLLLVQSKENLLDYNGRGDYHLDEDNKLCRIKEGEEAEFIYAGVQLLHPRALSKIAKDEAISFNPLWDIAQQKNRLYGIAFKGDWHHVGNPESLAEADRAFSLLCD